MTTDAKDGQKQAVKPVERRRIFISHTHADRELAKALKTLIERVTQHLLDVFLSSDPSPGGGLQPGDEWFPRIHSELQEAVAVWVLATEESLSRPWVYWEAGIGSVLCPGRLVIVQVGASEVPSPLSAFQVYDGLRSDDGGLGTALKKTGEQLGIALEDVLVDDALTDWITFATSFTPDAAASDDKAVSPERTGRIEATLSRVETMLHRFEEIEPWRRASRDSTRSFGDSVDRAPNQHLTPGQRRELASRATSPGRTLIGEESEALGGLTNNILTSLESAVEAIEHLPQNLSLHPKGFDDEGDLVLTFDQTDTKLYLRGDWLDDLPAVAPSIGSDRARQVLEQASRFIAD